MNGCKVDVVESDTILCVWKREKKNCIENNALLVIIQKYKISEFDFQEDTQEMLILVFTVIHSLSSLQFSIEVTHLSTCIKSSGYQTILYKHKHFYLIVLKHLLTRIQ